MSSLRAVFLTGERVYIRALTQADAPAAVAWFDTPFPINAPAAEEELKSEEGPWWAAMVRTYGIARRADDQLIGGVKESNWRGVEVELRLHLAPWLSTEEADALRAEALTLLVPWLVEERDVMVVAVKIADDEPLTIEAARHLGMTETARLRRHVARPGRRVDLLLYQRDNPHWENRHA